MTAVRAETFRPEDATYGLIGLPAIGQAIGDFSGLQIAHVSYLAQGFVEYSQIRGAICDLVPVRACAAIGSRSLVPGWDHRSFRLRNGLGAVVISQLIGCLTMDEIGKALSVIAESLAPRGRLVLLDFVLQGASEFASFRIAECSEEEQEVEFADSRRIACRSHSWTALKGAMSNAGLSITRQFCAFMHPAAERFPGWKDEREKPPFVITVAQKEEKSEA